MLTIAYFFAGKSVRVFAKLFQTDGNLLTITSGVVSKTFFQRFGEGNLYKLNPLQKAIPFHPRHQTLLKLLVSLLPRPLHRQQRHKIHNISLTCRMRTRSSKRTTNYSLRSLHKQNWNVRSSWHLFPLMLMLENSTLGLWFKKQPDKVLE